MGLARTIGTILATTTLSARHPRVETLTVLFLALTLLTVTTLPLMLPILELMTDMLPCLLYHLFVMIVIATTVARTLFRASPTLPETLTVHLQTFSFLACATAFLLLGNWSRSRHYILGSLHLVVNGQLRLLIVEELFRDVLVQTDSRAEMDVFLGLDQLQGVRDVRDRW